MSIKTFARSFAIIAVLVFVVTAAVSLLYSLAVHGSGQVDWELSFRLAIIFGIALPLVSAFEKKAST